MTTYAFPEAGTRITLTRSEPTRPTVEEQATAIVEQLRRVFPRLKLRARHEGTAGAARAVQLDVEWVNEAVVVRNVILVTLHDDAVWSLTATTPQERFAETQEAITRALASFRAKPV